MLRCNCAVAVYTRTYVQYAYAYTYAAVHHAAPSAGRSAAPVSRVPRAPLVEVVLCVIFTYIYGYI